MAVRHAVLAVTAVLAAAFSVAQGARPTNASLVIFTYRSNMRSGVTPPGQPRYDFAEHFAQHIGINKSDIEVIRFPDAPAIMQAAALAPSSADLPLPDILFGLDNVLQQELSGSLIFPYDSPNADYIKEDLLEAVASPDVPPITPYDYGYIAILIDKFTLAERAPDVLELLNRTDFQLMDLVEHAEKVFPLMTFQNPLTSGTGVNFFMWTIAVLGDEKLNFTGSMPTRPDWRQFWNALVQNNGLVTSSWSESFDVFLDKERPIMISYSTSPAYAGCVENMTDIYLDVYSKDDNMVRGWLSIEGVAITRYAEENENPARLELAKSFVDFVLSEEFQEEIALNNWMYPARMNVSLPQCYFDSGAVESWEPVNEFLLAPYIHLNIATWLNEVTAMLTPDTGDNAAAFVQPALAALFASLLAVAVAAVCAVAL